MPEPRKYTDTVAYFDAPGLFDSGKMTFAANTPAPQECPDSPVYQRARTAFHQASYMYPAPPLYLGQHTIAFPAEDQYVLRLLVKEPGSAFVLPRALAHLAAFVADSAGYQKAWFPDYEDRFAYLTVRSGIVKSTNDDTPHVDGFQGVSVPRHIPEQNYIWSDSHPTLFSLQPYFVEHVDPARHNIHDSFAKAAQPSSFYSALENGVYVMDPYHVHMRPALPPDTKRAFVRLTFSPVEVRDDTNMVNPWLPRGPYNREDVRNHLEPYDGPASDTLRGMRPAF